MIWERGTSDGIDNQHAAGRILIGRKYITKPELDLALAQQERPTGSWARSFWTSASLPPSS
jgi:hypothetical protein